VQSVIIILTFEGLHHLLSFIFYNQKYFFFTVPNVKKEEVRTTRIINISLAVGCNNFASLGTTIGGCTSVCEDNYNNFDLPRDGCKTSVPLHLSEFNARLQGIRKNSSVECSYALMS
jgi:hypothetical protein